MSDDDLLSMAGEGDEAAAEVEDTALKADSDLDSQQPNLECNFCMIKSTAQCPIAARKGVVQKVLWGKSSRKGKRMHNGKRKQIICGDLCLTCMRVYRLRWERTYKKKDKRKPLKIFKKDFTQKPEIKRKFKEQMHEYIRRRAGGKSRVHTLPQKLNTHRRMRVLTRGPHVKFWTLKAFKENGRTCP